MMALLALQEDYANGKITRKRDFRDHDDNWLICRFRFSKAELLDLCTELGPVERATHRNRAILVQIQVLTTLGETGCFQREMSES